jgi:hypothetical protein
MADDGGEFARQAAICRTMGSALTAGVLEAGVRVLDRAPKTARLVADWPGSRGEAAVGLRFAAGIHALARRGAHPALSALYLDGDGDWDRVVGDAIAAEDDFLVGWMAGAPQTNEVYRAGAIMAALLVAAERFGMPFELLELGSSGGLQLNLARFAYDLGGVSAGESESPLRIAPEWRGPPPPAAQVRVVSARGVDIDPLDVTDPAVRERLHAYVWADQPARVARLDQAFAIAAVHPPRIDRDDGAAWIEARLAEPQAPDTMRVVFHSIVLQYFPEDGRARVRAAIEAAGARATAERPLGWVAFEWDFDRADVELKLTMWPGGETRRLARCQAHAAWID